MAKRSGGKNKLDRKTARLLDANLNRAREGLRVVEDAARYVFGSSRHYKNVRRLRHQLHAVTASRYRDLVMGRDSRLDPGRSLRESRRESIPALISSNLRRAQEASRVLEEFSKVFRPGAASAFKSVRYRLYDLEKDLLKRMN